MTDRVKKRARLNCPSSMSPDPFDLIDPFDFVNRGRPWRFGGGGRRSRFRRMPGSRRLARKGRAAPRANWPSYPSARAIRRAIRRPRRDRRADERPAIVRRPWARVCATLPAFPWPKPEARRTIRPRRQNESRAVLGHSAFEANHGLAWASEDHSPVNSLALSAHVTKNTPFARVILCHDVIVRTALTTFPVVRAEFTESSCILPRSRGFSNF